MADGQTADEVTVFEAAGGEPAFRRLTDRFYAAVAADPVLRRVYPEQELDAARERLCLFLMQYWGGPTTYQQQRGHPRLRIRHAPFAIGAAERDAWIHHMRAALDKLALPPHLDEPIWEHLERAAYSLQNRPG